MISSICLLLPAVDLSDKGDAIKSNGNRDLPAKKNQDDKFYAGSFLGDTNERRKSPGDKADLCFFDSKNVGNFWSHKGTGKTAIWNGMGVYGLEN